MIVWYKWIRIVAYIAGLGGMATYLIGKNRGQTAGESLMVIGGGSILLCFILLFISYGMYMILRTTRKR